MDAAEKHEMVPRETVYAPNEYVSAADAEFLAGFTEEQRKKVLRKVDWRLVPMLLILYLISFIDRANIGTSGHTSNSWKMLTRTGNAKIEGMLKDLHMTGNQYNIALAIFFIPYTLAGE